MATNPAIGAEGMHLSVRLDSTFWCRNRGGQQGTGWTCLDAFSAGDARAVAHRVVKIEHDFRMGAAMGHANHVVDLDIAAGTDAERAIDTSIEIYHHRRMRKIGFWGQARGKAAFLNAKALSPLPEFRSVIVGIASGWLIGGQ